MCVFVHRNWYGHAVMRVVAEISVYKAEKTFACRARCRQHQQGQSNLRRNHDAVAAPCAYASHHPTRAALHQPGDLRPRELQRRPESKQNRRDERQRYAEEQYRHIHLDHGLRGERIFWESRGEEGKSSPCQKHAKYCSGRRDTQRFREQLPNHAQAAGTNSRSHGELVLPFVASRQKKNRYIRTAFYFNGSAPTEKQIQCRPKRPGVHLNDAAYLDSKRFRILRGRLLGKLLQDGLKFSARLCSCHSRAKLDRRRVTNIRI